MADIFAPDSSMRLTNRVCLITGASRGLGAAIAQLFWREGASLCLCARDKRALQALADSFETNDRSTQQCIIEAADLTEPSRPARIVEHAAYHFGRIDVLINNAAVQGPIGPLWESDFAEWEKCLRLDLIVPAALCAAVIPGMKNRGGKIVNLSGGGAAAPRPNFSAYAAGKTALVRLTETLAHETRGMKIDVNCVAPGAMPTQMLAEIVAAGPQKAGSREFAQAGENGKTGDEVLQRAAQLCLFLASSLSDGITGRLISARWDPWEQLAEHQVELVDSDIYTLRRIVPADRGQSWGEA
jgi:3-oxoacyl-[acyl-carrier protein] reductase